ncbi:MAG: Stp1/IreP family PP2C-type Ser/Thr phosphatase [Aristaeellaceae bacterium]
MRRKYKMTGAVSDYLKRFARGEILPRPAEEQPAPAAGGHDSQPPAQDPASAPAEEQKGLLVYALTDVGRVRASNQDAIIEGERLFGVADGMGGHKGGETASAGARDGLLELLEGKAPALDSLREAVMEVNNRLYRQQQGDENLSGMGTTLTALWFSGHYVYIGHVGDSRAYLLREGHLQQMTSDHSLVAELVRSGVLTPEQAEGHPMRNVITRAVGTEETVEVDLLVEERQAGDLWLVCSDGLYGMVPDRTMEAILTVNTPQAAAKLLLDAALAAGGHDNVTVVLLQDKEGSGE